MATYFVKVKEKDNYIKHESKMASTMYDEIEERGYEVEEAFVHHDGDMKWTKVIPKNTGGVSGGTFSSGALIRLDEKDYEIDYERLAKEICKKLIYFLPEPIEFNVNDYLVRFKSSQIIKDE